MRDGHKPLQMYPRQIPYDQRVDEMNNEAVDLTEGHPGHGVAGEDGGGGEEEECEAEDTVGEAQVNQQQTAGLPGLKKTNFADCQSSILD